MKYLIPIAAACLVLATSSCTKKAPEETAPAPQAAAEQAAPAEQNSAPEAQAKPEENKAPETAQDVQKKRVPRAFAPIELETLKSLPREDAEKKILSAFANSVDAEMNDLQQLIDRAELGDDRAKEEFANKILKRPATDPNYKRALNYLRSIREFKDPDAMMRRGILEFTSIAQNPEAKEEAKKYLIQAAEMDYEPALDYLLKNQIFEMRDYAYKKLDKLFETKAAGRDPKVLYEWARMLEFGEPSDMPRANKLIEEAANGGYLPAQFTHAVTLMASQQTWASGFELIQKAAAAGSEEASLLLATLYSVALFSDSAQSASEMYGSEISEENYTRLKGILNTYQSETSQDPKMLISETAHKAGGYDEACGILLALSTNEDNAPYAITARKYAIDCYDRFVQAYPTRDACDHAVEQVAGLSAEQNGDEVDFTQFFTDEQRTQLGKIVLSCYQIALEDGNDYTSDAQSVGISTGMMLSSLHSGAPVFNITEDKSREIAYLLYSASANDVISQVTLANYYHDPEFILHDLPRACFWFQMADASHICKNFCGDEDSDAFPVCEHCKVAALGVGDCIDTIKKAQESAPKTK